MHAGAAARILAAGPGRLRNLELGKTVEGVWVHAPAVRSWARPTHLRRSAQAGEATQRRSRLAVHPRAWLSPTLAGFHQEYIDLCGKRSMLTAHHIWAPPRITGRTQGPHPAGYCCPRSACTS